MRFHYSKFLSKRYQFGLFNLFDYIFPEVDSSFSIIFSPAKALYIRYTLKGKVRPRWKFQAFIVWNYLIRSMWCLMLLPESVREIGFSAVLYGRFPALKINPVRKVGSTWVSKGQCFETPAFRVEPTPKIARNCSGFRWVAVAVTEHWSFKSGSWIQNQVTEYWSFKSGYECFKSRPDAWIWVCQDRKIDPLRVCSC